MGGGSGMTTIPFMRPRLTGPRFEDHGIPLEFLKDLAVLEEMVVEVAKWKFLQAHPDRQRSRRGFFEGAELKLTGVEEGSAVPLISLVLALNTLFPPANQEYLEQGRDAIISAIAAAEENRPVTRYLPEKSLSYFDRIGRSLRDGEAMEFPTSSSTPPARLTRDTRRRLLLASSSVKELTEDTEARGTISEVDLADSGFEIQLADGRKIRAPMAPQHIDTIVKALVAGYESGTRVLLQGVGKYDRNARLQSFEEIEHISVLDPLDVSARLDEFRDLRDGWLDGAGRAPSGAGLDWLARAFGQHFPDDLSLPFAYPTAEGGVQLEWSLDPYEITLEIDLAGHTGEWHALHMATNAEEARDLSMDSPDAWEWLADQIRQAAGGVA